MARWLLYDTHQGRFISALNPETMQNKPHLYRTREEAQYSAREMGMESLLLPVRTINSRETLRMLDRNGRLKTTLSIKEVYNEAE